MAAHTHTTTTLRAVLSVQLGLAIMCSVVGSILSSAAVAYFLSLSEKSEPVEPAAGFCVLTKTYLAAGLLHM